MQCLTLVKKAAKHFTCMDMREFFLKSRSHLDFWKRFKFWFLDLKQNSLRTVHDSEEHVNIAAAC